jgi:hypothetical protein
MLLKRNKFGIGCYIHEIRGFIGDHRCNIALNVVVEIVIRYIRNLHNTR